MSEPVELSGNQCLELLERHGIGRVAFGTPMGPRIVPVKYTLEGSEIFFRAPPFSEVGTYAPNTDVAFEVDDIDAVEHCGCSVVALGRAELVDNGDGGNKNQEKESKHEPYRRIRVRAHDITGLHIGD